MGGHFAVVYILCQWSHVLGVLHVEKELASGHAQELDSTRNRIECYANSENMNEKLNEFATKCNRTWLGLNGTKHIVGGIANI